MKAMSEYTEAQLKVMSESYDMRGKAAKTELERREKRYGKFQEAPKGASKAQQEEAVASTGESTETPEKAPEESQEPAKETTKAQPKRRTKRKTSATKETGE